MSENTKIWDLLGRTDPAHTQQFKRGGGFKGTAIKPIWSFRRMTEEFGPCGIGWGVNEPSFQVVQGDNREVLVYCTASVWYRYGDETTRTVFGVGGDKIVTHIRASEQYNRPERWENDDEAFKKAFTDAVTNALKLIGVGADVHMGRFDDNKYVKEMRDEFAEEAQKDATPKRQVGYRDDGTRTAHALRKDDIWPDFERELMECETIPMLTKLAVAWSAKAEADKWPVSWKDMAREQINNRREWLKNNPPADDFPGDLKTNAYAQSVMAG